MKKILIFLISIILFFSCSQHDLKPIKYDSILGTWEIKNSEIMVTFDVVLVKNPPSKDTLFTTNSSVIYLNKKALSLEMQNIKNVNNNYTFLIITNIGECPKCVANVTQLASFKPNDSFTEMYATQTNDLFDGSWVSVVYYDGTPTNKVIILKEPLIIKRIK
jgi:hypothetical protein